MNSKSNKLINCINKSLIVLDHITETKASIKLNSNVWSLKEILGHLIDSAINNYRRIIIASKSDSLIFDEYDQNYWVKSGNYHQSEWNDTLSLWRFLNLHMAQMIENINQSVIGKEHKFHNLNDIGFNTFEKSQSSSLNDLIEDYIDHIEHHIHQIELRITEL